jgi:hypothetical protein
MKELREIHMYDHRLPLEPAYVELDEGLEFPISAYTLDSKIMSNVSDSRPDMTRTSVEFLSGALSLSWAEEERESQLYPGNGYQTVGFMDYHQVTDADILV